MVGEPACIPFVHCAEYLMGDVTDPVPLSWRDPDGFVVKSQGRILRAVVSKKSEQTRMLLRAPWMVRFIEEGLVPKTVEVAEPLSCAHRGATPLWLEHETLQFPCYPHEITALQLYDSALLTLRIAIESAQQGWILKDASAWNVLHSAGRPVFVDLLSFERQQPTGEWIAYGQFVRHFVLPLLLYRKLAMTPPEIFLIHRDGISPERAYQLLRGLDLISAAALEIVVLPKLLSRSGGRMIAAKRPTAPTAFDASMGLPLLLRTLHRLHRMVERLRPDFSKLKSLWGGYEETRSHYSDADLEVKTAFVRRHLGNCQRVLDLGCNAGEFSLLAAEAGRTVVSADADDIALSRLYERIRGKGSTVTPIFLNIGRPTPSVGWENRETESFLDRSVGQFDCVLVLGLIHHLLVSERATLDMVVNLLARLGPKQVILEWVDPTDPKFQQVAGLNASLYKDLDSERLESCMGQKYSLREKLALPCGTRVMYLWGGR